MVVKLDLRLPKRDQGRARIGFETSAALSCRVPLCDLIHIGFYHRWVAALFLRDQRLELNKGASSNTEKIAVMDKELGRITGEMTKLESKLSYLLSDIPSVELLTSLAKIIPDGINVESFSMTLVETYTCGTGKNDEQILLFANELNEANFAKSVSVPVISPGNRNSISVRTFKLECVLLPLDQIIASGNLDREQKERQRQRGKVTMTRVDFEELTKTDRGRCACVFVIMVVQVYFIRHIRNTRAEIEEARRESQLAERIFNAKTDAVSRYKTGFNIDNASAPTEIESATKFYSF